MKTDSKIEELERRLEKERAQKKKIMSRIQVAEKKQEEERRNSICHIVDAILGKVMPTEFEALEQILQNSQEAFEQLREKKDETDPLRNTEHLTSAEWEGETTENENAY